MKKTFTKILEAVSFYNVHIDGKKKNNKFDQMNMVHSELQKTMGYKNAADVSDNFHQMYKNSGNYISATGKKDDRSNKHIRNMMAMGLDLEHPMISIDKDGKINFENGQHRYAMLTRMGQSRMVAMSDDSFNYAKKHGYIK